MTFMGLSTLSYVAGTLSVLAASKLYRYVKIARERRRIKRLDALLSQIVVEDYQPNARVLPDSGAIPKRPQNPGKAYVKLRKMVPPPRPLRPPGGTRIRRLSEVWMEDDIVHIPQSEPIPRRGTRGDPQGPLDLDSLNSFKSLD